MATTITVDVPHQLGRVEARRRIETDFAKIVLSLPGGGGHCDHRWEADAGSDRDRSVFSVAVMGQTVCGVVDVFDTVVKLEIELPGAFGLFAGGLKSQLQKTGLLLLAKK